MNWQELKHALLELFESFSLPFDDHAAEKNQRDMQPVLIPIQQDESSRRR